MASRTFTVIGVSVPRKAKMENECLGGLFKSKTPMSAAKKASRRICRICGVEGQCTTIVHLRETTAGSKHKEYVYKIRRIKNETKVVKTDANKKKVKITFKFTTKATSLNQFENL